MLPGSLSLEMRTKSFANASFLELENGIREQDKFAQDHGPKAGVHLNESGAKRRKPVAQADFGEEDGEEEEYEDDEDYELDPAVMKLMMPLEMCAFMKQRVKRLAGSSRGGGRLRGGMGSSGSREQPRLRRPGRNRNQGMDR